MSEARMIRIAFALVGLELAFLLFVYLPCVTMMDARFTERFGCTPAEMAQQLKGGSHE